MAKPEPSRRKMTIEEIRADVERMQRDPKIIAMIREGHEAERRGDGVRLEDLKRRHGGR